MSIYIGDNPEEKKILIEPNKAPRNKK